MKCVHHYSVHKDGRDFFAHLRFDGVLMDSVNSGHWPKNIKKHDFTPQTEGHEYDAYYCGHGGWD